MFTGIVTDQGTLLEKSPVGGDVRLKFKTGSMELSSCRPGDSISVSGVCLTMLDMGRHSFHADVSAETLELTTLGGLEIGATVNLELAMQAEDRFGGHLVTGHVDGLARLEDRRPDGRAERLSFRVPPALAHYIARKGSVALDGVSLTVNGVDGTVFDICLIPHTLEVTTLGRLVSGDAVNLEIDLVARYLERMLEQREAEHLS